MSDSKAVIIQRSEFVFPSDADRAENEDLDRVCQYAEELVDRHERKTEVFRRRGQEVRELSASLQLAQGLLKRAATITVGSRGIVPVFAQEYDQELKQELESYQQLPPDRALAQYTLQCQVEVLEEVLPHVTGYAKRTVESKIRRLQVAIDKEQPKCPISK